MTDLECRYDARYGDVLVPLAERLAHFITSCVGDLPRVDRISARAKSPQRFVAKSAKLENGRLRYRDPLAQIQDQIGARIVTFYLADVEIVSERIKRYFRPIEQRQVIPDADDQFGYVGKHFILLLPEDVIDDDKRPATPNCFELQIKTLFQHAWSEANHDLAYKPNVPLSSDELRIIAFTAAQAWGADRMFNDVFAQQNAEGHQGQF